MIEELEQSTVRPIWLFPTLSQTEYGKTLMVDSLYWGTRRLVTKLTADTAVMTNAAEFLHA